LNHLTLPVAIFFSLQFSLKLANQLADVINHIRVSNPAANSNYLFSTVVLVILQASIMAINKD